MSADTNPGRGQDFDTASNVRESVRAWFLESPADAPINAWAFMTLSHNHGLLKIAAAIEMEGRTDASKYWLARGISFGYVFHDLQRQAANQVVDVIEDETIKDVFAEWSRTAMQDLVDSEHLEGEELDKQRLKRGIAISHDLTPDLMNTAIEIAKTPGLQGLKQQVRQSFIEGAMLVDRLFIEQRKRTRPQDTSE